VGVVGALAIGYPSLFVVAGPHRDPFDRMLIAQAMIEEMVLVSNEQLFDNYGVQRLWQ
jgi:PIN domain nuclease of toxin-antitoxin system